MLIEFNIASFIWEAFWKIDMAMSFFVLNGGPRGGKSGDCRVGVMALPEPVRCSEDELDVELRDLLI